MKYPVVEKYGTRSEKAREALDNAWNDKANGRKTEV